MMPDENFKFSCSRILSPWLKKISINSSVLKYNKMKDFNRYLRESESTFTMVGDNFEKL